MLPIYLSIDGLYSYKTKQEIDFTRLTEAGLFGIFGKVGSGKSSILEAMTFALYGDTNRLNSKNRAYNMMNLNTDHLKIVFEFIGKENKKYSFEAGWKRNGKNFEKVSTIERKAYVYENGIKIPLESNDAEAVIGISYKNFNRTVIVPQGQFKEFLELKGTDRSIMMKELFNLDRYDLYQKAADLKSVNQSAVEQIQGSLQILTDYTEETFTALTQNLEHKEASLILKEKEFTVKEEEINKLHEMKKLQSDLIERRQELELMKQQKQAITDLKQRVILFEKTEKTFKNLLEAFEKESDNFQRQKEALKDTEEKLSKKKAQTEDVASEFEKINDEISKNEYYKILIADLENMLSYKKQLGELDIIHNRLQKAAVFIENTKKNLDSKQKELTLKKEKTEYLKRQKADTGLLFAVEAWFQKNKTLNQHLEQSLKTIADKEVMQTELQQFFIEHQLKPETAKETLMQRNLELKEQIHQTQQHINQLNVQKQLVQYADELHNGIPCPLCGSEDHPHIMKSSDVTERLQEFDLQYEKLSKNLDQLIQLQNQLEIVTGKTELLHHDLKNEKDTKEATLASLKKHQEAFIWDDFDAEDYTTFHTVKETSQKIEKEIENHEIELKSINSEVEKLQGELEKYTSAVKNIEKDASQKTGSIGQLKEAFKQLNTEDYLNLTKEDIVSKKEKITETVQTNEKRYTTLIALKEKVQTDMIRLEYQKTSQEKSVAEIENAVRTYSTSIQLLLHQNNFETIEEVLAILSLNLDTETCHKEIREFEDRFHLTEHTVAQLEEKTKNQQWDASYYDAVLLNYQQLKEGREILIGEIKSVKDQLEEHKKRSTEKKKLSEQLEQLDLRSKNLSVLMNLFKGSGFVNFISTQYLEELCCIANQRFERLTRGQLTLVINEDNDFEVVDHLNSDRQRSVKTLSGGQFFQASLCLALALAENTRSLNKNEKNFFFIDEGFGTQDNESVNLIFETLNNLRNENRIVGIISHVEELQERIPASVSVVKDSERGSLIKIN